MVQDVTTSGPRYTGVYKNRKVEIGDTGCADPGGGVGVDVGVLMDVQDVCLLLVSSLQ